tara:strand:+ start:1697 stop:1939 length:243 start_codon:yes stop_codon:yes gene_type:complete
MTDREIMQQALEALEWVNTSVWLEDCYHAFDEEVAALRDRLAQPERIQLTVRDFVVTVGDIEDAVGTPMYWAEWPNKEQP